MTASILGVITLTSAAATSELAGAGVPMRPGHVAVPENTTMSSPWLNAEFGTLTETEVVVLAVGPLAGLIVAVCATAMALEPTLRPSELSKMQSFHAPAARAGATTEPVVALVLA